MTLAGRRIAIIGDSHMQALGPLLRRQLPALGATVVGVTARQGWSVRRYVRAGDVPALVNGSDTVLIELGGNDASAGVSDAAHEQDIEAMLDQVGSRRVIWIGPGVTSRVSLERVRTRLRPVERRVVTRAGGRWIDGEGLTSFADLRSDGVHYTIPEGYERFASKIVSALSGPSDAVIAALTVAAIGTVAAVLVLKL